MRILRNALAVALLIASTALVVSLICLVRVATVTVGAVPGEIQATRQELIGEITATRKDLNRLLEGTRSDLNMQVEALQTETLAEVAEFRETADRRIGDTLARVDTALGTFEGVRADLQPVIDGAATLEADADKTVKDLRPQLLGLVAAGKVTAGEAATTMREIQRATPEILADVKDATAHIDGATEASQKASVNAAAVTGNLAAATKPLPRAVRIGLQIGGPIAQMTSYVILMLASLEVL
jgi:hypothetical protein